MSRLTAKLGGPGDLKILYAYKENRYSNFEKTREIKTHTLNSDTGGPGEFIGPKNLC